MLRTLAAFEGWPLNVGLQACARTDEAGGARRRSSRPARSGSRSTRTTARTRSSSTRRCATPKRTTSRSRSTPTGCTSQRELEDTVAAIAGRTVHAYHVEGTGGGHVPDLIGLVREANVLCSSTTPTAAVRASRRRRARGDDPPRTTAGTRGCRRMSRSSASGSTRPRWPPRDRSTSSARSRSSTPTRRAWAGSARPCAGRSSSPTSMKGWRATEAGSAWPDLPDEAATRSTTTSGSCATSPRSRSSRRSSTASPTRSARSGRATWPTSSCGSRRFFGVKPEAVIKGGAPAWGPLGEGNASRRALGADPLRRRLGRSWPGAGGCRGHLRVGCGAGRGARWAPRHPSPARGRARLPGRHPGIALVEPGDDADRRRPGRRDRDAGRPDAGRRAGRRGAPQPALPAALTVSSDPG